MIDYLLVYLIIIRLCNSIGKTVNNRDVIYGFSFNFELELYNILIAEYLIIVKQKALYRVIDDSELPV
ncbi:conserved hypothetical protein [Xenorhabdus nematophila F1]|uniref:Uncharacterized protein n=1 Tax=Xenorhabdus nematophila (strain ATCC 19061 / DSM 3370 / CCUG 14189 / LMG 1036 / NCIMB 9965 / AN6) TaxID=406817 RepID=D3VKI5_XENNA|nr:hypothetical protein XNC1_0866 [Xenorhabdus nematophila ATCC 19061]CCW32915.1 conserved hypothetical protein [Xenorhabdus nematophila F1]CEE93118.1 hypothetical protein XNA1_340002 [Xenorhabdus nematophila str. Anatoliense]CEE95286.1 hypothetical protein XNA1_5060003 [Xenorhabdus nematophila str. Anatoliense]CEK21846.1 hypothetical protein XNC2_0850 [Xenorhabdus nematophila AN6/1]